MKRLRFRQVMIFLSMLFFVFSTGVSTRAQEADESAPVVDNPENVRVARLSFFYGETQVQRPGSDWQDAQINLPLEEGSQIRTEDGRAEIQFDDGSVLRLAQSTTAELTELSLATGRPSTKVSILSGTAILVGRVTGGEIFRLVTPNLDVDVPTGAGFRVDATDGNSWVTALIGNLQINAGGAINPLSAGNVLHIGADGQTDVDASPAADDFDTWSVDRDRMLASGYASAEPYVAPYQPDFNDAAADLSAYGYWGNISGCGACWIPFGVSARWMPFGIGSWRYYHRLGWTWISAEPWGWLPYHYGKWFYTTHGWAWSPNPVRRFNPGAVDWIKADGKTAWVPRGSFGNARRPDGSAGYVTGTEEHDGVIRSLRGTGSGNPVRTSSSPIVIAGRPPAPSVPSAPREVTSGGKTIVYDPGSRTYVNGEPKRETTRDAQRGDSEVRRATPRTARNEDERKSERSVAARPQFGPPSTFAPATSQHINSPAAGESETPRPVRGAPGSAASGTGERTESAPASSGSSGWRSAEPAHPVGVPVQTAPHNSAPATPHTSAPAPAPHVSAPAAPAPPPHAAAPAPTPHAAPPTPHR